MDTWWLYLILGGVGLVGVIVIFRQIGIWLLVIGAIIAVALLGGAVWSQSRATATVATTATVNNTLFGVIAIAAIIAVPSTLFGLVYLLRTVQRPPTQAEGGGRWLGGPNAQWQQNGGQSAEFAWMQQQWQAQQAQQQTLLTFLLLQFLGPQTGGQGRQLPPAPDYDLVQWPAQPHDDPAWGLHLPEFDDPFDGGW